MSGPLPWRQLSLVFLLWSGLTILPYLQAASFPPKGRWFTGFFHYQDDLYQDLSFVEQARRGELAFKNKFDIRPQQGFLINLEWAGAGLLARALGLGPIGGFHALGFVAAFVFVAAAARVLLSGGCRSLPWALGIVLAGGGLGWFRLWMGARQWTLPDLATTLFPWNQRLAGGPHALLGSGLFLWALVGFVEWRAGRPRRRWLVPATLLGLIRPFDLGIFGATAAVVLALEAPRAPNPWRHWLRAVLDLVWLVPVLFYDLLAFALHPAFAVWSGAQNAIAWSGLGELFLSLGPAAAIGFAGLRKPPPIELAASLRRALAVAALCMAALSTSASFGFQFLNSLGAVVLSMAALGLRERWLPLAASALAPSSLVLLWQAWNPSPQLFAPRDYQETVRLLERRCRSGDVLVAPIDLSLLVAGLTPCHVALGHWVLTPEREARGRESERFYDPATSAAWRVEYLRSIGAAFVALPGGKGAWLGDGSGFRPLLGTPLLELWAGSARRPRAGRSARPRWPAQGGYESDAVETKRQQPQHPNPEVEDVVLEQPSQDRAKKVRREHRRGSAFAGEFA